MDILEFRKKSMKMWEPRKLEWQKKSLEFHIMVCGRFIEIQGVNPTIEDRELRSI